MENIVSIHLSGISQSAIISWMGNAWFYNTSKTL